MEPDGRQTGERWLDGSSGGAAGHFVMFTFDRDDELTRAADSNTSETFADDSGGVPPRRSHQGRPAPSRSLPLPTASTTPATGPALPAACLPWDGRRARSQRSSKKIHNSNSDKVLRVSFARSRPGVRARESPLCAHYDCVSSKCARTLADQHRSRRPRPLSTAAASAVVPHRLASGAGAARADRSRLCSRPPMLICPPWVPSRARRVDETTLSSCVQTLEVPKNVQPCPTFSNAETAACVLRKCIPFQSIRYESLRSEGQKRAVGHPSGKNASRVRRCSLCPAESFRPSHARSLNSRLLPARRSMLPISF
jgi:hypothetical protein